MRGWVGGWERRSRGGGIESIHGIDLGTWLQKKLENLSAAPDKLVILAEKRETSPPIFVFCMTCFCPSPCFQYVPTTVVVLIRQSIHTLREA